MLILNLPIKCAHFAILPEIEGVSNATSIEVYGRIYTSPAGPYCRRSILDLL